MRKRGFSMLSVMISLALIAMFAAVFMKMQGGNPATGRPGKVDAAKIQAVNMNFSAIKMGLQTYFSANGRFPSTKEGLAALSTLVRYLNTNDPWGHPYHYESPGRHNKDSYDLATFGKDGKPGGVGENADITNYR